MLRTLAATAFVAALATAASLGSLVASAHAQTRMPGQIVVLLAPQSANALAPDAAGRAVTTDARLAAALERHGLDHADAIGPVRARQGRTMLLTSSRADFDADAAVRDLVASGAVRAAAPNQTLDSYVLPNDPMLGPKQWHLSTSAAGIRAQNAWGLETGDSAVSIAIIDSGVDRTHPDLAAKIWRNGGEIPNNGLDDDGNGLVDDVNGWDYVDNDNNPNPLRTIPPAAGIDVGFHGSFIAGLAAAATNNAIGIAGVDWEAKLMPLRVTDTLGVISLARVVTAWQYAVDKQAAVINLSFGGTDPSLQSIFQTLVNDAIDANVMCVAAAGNDGNDLAHYPAACESVLAVASTTSANQRAPTSCWGWYVDIAAPGENVWSTIPTNYTLDAGSAFIFSFAYGWDGVNPYMFNSGTSFSAPVVAGACALVRAKFPGAPATLVMKHVVETADVVTYDNDIGGRLNVYQALLTTIDAPPPTLDEGVSFAIAPVAPNPMRSGGTIELALSHAGDARVAIFDSRGRFVRALFDGPLVAGPHRLSWNGADDGGARVPPGLYFVRAEVDGVARARRVTVLQP